MLIRKLKFLTSWEAESLEDFRDLELLNDDGEPDLTLSVYEVEAATRGPQVLAEHYAGPALDPPRPKYCSLADVSSIGGDPLPQPGQTGFRFTVEAHRDLTFGDGEAVSALAGALLADARARRSDVDPKELFSYVKSRVDEQDAEWLSCLRGMPESTRERWLKKCKVKIDAE